MSLMDRLAMPPQGLPGEVVSLPQAGPLNEAGATTIEQDDGGVIVQFGPPPAQGPETIPPDANLIDYLDEAMVAALVHDIDERVKGDNESRKDWLDTYRKGVELLGLKAETPSEDYVGITTLRHPLLASACLRFWSFARAELLPPQGPADTEVIGLQDDMSAAQAERVKTYFNYWATEEAQEYYPDDSQMLLYLPLGGTCFKKIYIDSTYVRPTSRFVLPDDLIVNYAATSLDNADRITHVLHLSQSELRRQQIGGFYKDKKLAAGDSDKAGDLDNTVREAADKAQGIAPPMGEQDRIVLHEVHAYVDLAAYVKDKVPEGVPEGVPVPLIITYHKDTLTPLAIRRNYRENDPTFKRIEYFVRYPFLPGLGFYGIGFAHLLGGISEATTGMLRSMLDAALYANFPAGFKARSLKTEQSAALIRPGEFADVDCPPGTLKDSIIPLPFKGVDQGAFALYQALAQDGDKLASIQAMPTGEMNPNAPVGTTLALLEEGGRITNAVLQDLFVARRSEFRILGRLFGASLPDQYPYRVKGAEGVVMRTDFDERVDIVPVAKASAASKTQRIAQAQTKWGLIKEGKEAGIQIDALEGLKSVFRDLGVEGYDTLFPEPEQAITADPATENVMAMGGKAIKPHPAQNHQAHIAAHMAFGQMVASNPAVAGIMQGLGPMLQAHVAEHFAMMYAAMMQAQTGAPVGQPIPPEMEAQVSVAVAQASGAVAQGMAGPQGQQAQQSPEMGIVAAEFAKVEQRREQVEVEAQLEREKMDLEEKKLATKIVTDSVEAERDRAAAAARQTEKLTVDLTKELAKDIATPTPAYGGNPQGVMNGQAKGGFQGR